MVNVAVLGYGTVGSGVVEVLSRNADVLKKSAGQEINLKYVLDLKEFPGTPIENKVVHDFNIILNDNDVSVIVEVMGGVNPAYSFVKSALLRAYVPLIRSWLQNTAQNCLALPGRKGLTSSLRQVLQEEYLSSDLLNSVLPQMKYLRFRVS